MSWYVAMLYHDIIRRFIMIYCADLRGKLFLEKVKSSHDLNFCPKKRSKSWLIAIIYHEILRRYIMICKNDQECLSRLENLSFLFLTSEILWYILKINYKDTGKIMILSRYRYRLVTVPLSSRYHFQAIVTKHDTPSLTVPHLSSMLITVPHRL